MSTNPDGIELKDPRIAAVLAWLFPGLGHFYQERWLKGGIFCVFLCSCFFYGWWLGEGSNVYFAKDRYAYYGQFFAGLLSLPASLQTWFGNIENGLPILGHLQALPHENVLDQLYRNKATLFEIGTLYTTVAGLLNILVICDAYGGPVYGRAPDAESEPSPHNEPKTSEA